MARAVIKIDLSSIPSNFSISKAVLKLYKYGQWSLGSFTYEHPGTYRIHQITRKWDETGATWEKATGAEKWAKPGGDFLPAVIDSFNYDGKLNNAWFTWDVTKAIAAMAKNPASNFGFIILTVDKNPSSLFTNHQDSYFRSSEAAETSFTPRLVVTGSIGSTKVTGETVSPAGRLFRIQCSRHAVSVCVPKQAAYSVSVTDHLGRTLFRHGGMGASDRERVPCRLTPGLYCITVQSGKVSQTQKAMVY